MCVWLLELCFVKPYAANMTTINMAELANNQINISLSLSLFHSECGCHPNTSTAQQCNDDGVCQCVSTAMGDKCGICVDGYHIIESGCVGECIAC